MFLGILFAFFAMGFLFGFILTWAWFHDNIPADVLDIPIEYMSDLERSARRHSEVREILERVS
jgi:hypothetical protein